MSEPPTFWQGFKRFFRPAFPEVIPGGEDLTPKQKRALVYKILDNRQSFWKRLTIWWVASSGFYTDSYNLFATNVILPMVAYVYWGDVDTSYHETIINILTLLGSLVGQLLFGYLTDQKGRRKIYGLELVIVLFGTIGIVQCSAGYDNKSMSILTSICIWRFIIGVGIGAEYPISATIAAEFSPLRSRAQIMAAVFLMQPLGQLSATLIGYGVINGLCHQHNITTESNHETIAPVIDIAWRIIIGVGAIPALLAVVARLSIPESPRFILDVEDNPNEAIDTLDREGFARPDVEASRNHPARDHAAQLPTGQTGSGQGVDSELVPPSNQTVLGGYGTHLHQRQNSMRIEPAPTGQRETELPPAEMETAGEATVSHHRTSISRKASQAPAYMVPESWSKFFWEDGNWRSLAATSGAWWAVDFVFYGLGINNPRTIAKIWADHIPAQNVTSPPLQFWQDPYNPDNTIYQVLQDDAVHSMITVSIGSLVGSLLLVFFIDYIPRRQYLVISFAILTGLFAIVGSAFLTSTFGNSLHGITIMLYVLCQLFFNFGPNTLIFIIPAEIFPTPFRATAHGISAAFGKLGSIIVLSFLPKANFGSQDSFDSPRSDALGKILLVFCAVMAFGGLLSWAWIPELQEPFVKAGKAEDQRRWTWPSKTLEELARGREGDGGGGWVWLGAGPSGSFGRNRERSRRG